MDRLLTPTETREQLHCSLQQVYQLSHQRALPKYKLGGRLFFKEKDVEAFIEAHRIDARVPVDP